MTQVQQPTGPATRPDLDAARPDLDDRDGFAARVLLLSIDAATGELGYRAVSDNPVELAGVGVPVEFDVTRFR